MGQLWRYTAEKIQCKTAFLWKHNWYVLIYSYMVKKYIINAEKTKKPAVPVQPSLSESIITNCQHATLLTLCHQFSVWGLITRITILKPERSDT